jgi:hypothetical protein
LESEIKYKKCGEQNGDTHTVKKSDVFMIKYANGTKDVFNGDSKDAAKNKAEEKTDSGIFGILSFVFIVLGVVLASPTAGISLIIFIPAAIVFGAIGLGPDRTNRGFAMAGLILGIITVFFFLVALIAYADGL